MEFWNVSRFLLHPISAWSANFINFPVFLLNVIWLSSNLSRSFSWFGIYCIRFGYPVNPGFMFLYLFHPVALSWFGVLLNFPGVPVYSIWSIQWFPPGLKLLDFPGLPVYPTHIWLLSSCLILVLIFWNFLGCQCIQLISDFVIGIQYPGLFECGFFV